MNHARLAFVLVAIGVAAAGLYFMLDGRAAEEKPQPQTALYWRALKDPPRAVACELCPRLCLIPEGGLGFCRARQNQGGKLITLGYSQPCAVHVDPIEKKPFFNYLPGSQSFSIAAAGCNLRCQFCQNWEISQVSPLETVNRLFTPEKVVEMATRTGCKSIAYTYTEPTNFYEYMLATCKLARKQGLRNVYHSNGYINQKPLAELCKYLDAANIDLKGFSDDFYRQMCEGASMQPVLETLKTLKRAGVWLEITNLVIPGANDDPERIQAMCEWIVKNLGPDVPVHFSRFTPLHRLQHLPPTPPETLANARRIALAAGLRYVYVGNLPGTEAENTFCPKCGKLVVKRAGYVVQEIHITAGKCEYCGQKIAGDWGT